MPSLVLCVHRGSMPGQPNAVVFLLVCIVIFLRKRGQRLREFLILEFWLTSDGAGKLLGSVGIEPACNGERSEIISKHGHEPSWVQAKPVSWHLRPRNAASARQAAINTPLKSRGRDSEYRTTVIQGKPPFLAIALHNGIASCLHEAHH